MKPNFLVIGAGKCGTSSLCTLIGRHPDAFMCDPKEPFFFSHDRNYLGKGWAWYESLFAGAAGRTAIGEGSVTYTIRSVFPHAAPRIAKDLPDARLIYITRHPLEQIESAWMMLRSFWRVLWPDGIRALPDFNRSVRETPMLLEAARFRKQIDWYRDFFPDDRILVLFFEDFTADPDAVLRRSFTFLGLDPVAIPESSRPVNVSKEHRYDRWFFKPMRLLPGAVAIRERLPRGVRSALRPFLRRRGTGRPQWSPDTRRWVIDELAWESREFLTRYGKPADFWDFEDDAAAPEPACDVEGA